jgi:hypothetical protein
VKVAAESASDRFCEQFGRGAAHKIVVIWLTNIRSGPVLVAQAKPRADLLRLFTGLAVIILLSKCDLSFTGVTQADSIRTVQMSKKTEQIV